MSELPQRIQPFSAMIFNHARCGGLDGVVAPPYDLIDRHRQEELYARSPYNVVRLELSRAADPYKDAAETLAQWLHDGILERRRNAAIFLYTQIFRHQGRTRVRNGLIARVRLDEFRDGNILPHEQTFPKAKEDRLRLLTSTHTNISPIFGIYPPADTGLRELTEQVGGRPPMLTATDDSGIVNQVRAIESSAEIALVQRALNLARILIADGHHRYETALEYCRRARAIDGGLAAPRPCDHVMMALVAWDDPGLAILPTHRLVHHLDGSAISSFDSRSREVFDVESVDDADTMLAALSERGRGTLAVALKGERKFRLLALRNAGILQSTLPAMPRDLRELDVSILHTLLLERIFGISAATVRAGGNIEYTVDADGALKAISSGAADGAFLMNPPTVDDIQRVSAIGATMPEKSTYFYPKLLTGLVMNPLD